VTPKAASIEWGPEEKALPQVQAMQAALPLGPYDPADPMSLRRPWQIGVLCGDFLGPPRVPSSTDNYSKAILFVDLLHAVWTKCC
jgi:hypothetical protein